jgi:hypothetical protein
MRDSCIRRNAKFSWPEVLRSSRQTCHSSLLQSPTSNVHVSM